MAATSNSKQRSIMTAVFAVVAMSFISMALVNPHANAQEQTLGQLPDSSKPARIHPIGVRASAAGTAFSTHRNFDGIRRTRRVDDCQDIFKGAAGESAVTCGLIHRSAGDVVWGLRSSPEGAFFANALDVYVYRGGGVYQAILSGRWFDWQSPHRVVTMVTTDVDGDGVSELVPESWYVGEYGSRMSYDVIDVNATGNPQLVVHRDVLGVALTTSTGIEERGADGARVATVSRLADGRWFVFNAQ
jgi:hypothetical protein